MPKIAILLTFVLLAVSGVAFADPTGNWILNMDGPMGPEEWKMNLKTDGTVDGEHPVFGSVEGTHKCTDKKWDVYFKLETPVVVMELNFIGTISGSSARGNLNMMGVDIPWAASKK